jgi:hypothetical protein
LLICVLYRSFAEGGGIVRRITKMGDTNCMTVTSNGVRWRSEAGLEQCCEEFAVCSGSSAVASSLIFGSEIIACRRRSMCSVYYATTV